MAIEVANRQRLRPIDSRAVARLAQSALDEIGRSGAALTIAFVRDRRVRDLNRTYRGKDVATDVLSFPAGDGQSDSPADRFAHEAAVYLGDIVISTDTALRQAEEADHSFEREVSELVIHGTLHLCGYDHETDGGEMNRLELKLRRHLLDGGR
ncbi:MAG TPA: rRNA maturation RNase YbeY [Blastocatellia bacterium]|nr:rRNA maturation RNase YbeY [Blastocatellia bacterium]